MGRLTDTGFDLRRAARFAAGWTAATAAVAATVIGMEITGDRLMLAAKLEELPLAFLYLGWALNFVSTRVLLAPVRVAVRFGWSSEAAVVLGLLAMLTWGALLAFGVRTIVRRRHAAPQ